MRTIKGLTNTITGILITEKENKDKRKTANRIIEFLFEEDNLAVPPKQDHDLRLKMFGEFFEWYKSKEYKELKKDYFQEWLWTL